MSGPSVIPSVISVSRALIAEDNTFVQVFLAALGGSQLGFAMTPSSLNAVVTHLNDLNFEVQTRIASTTGHVETRAPDVQAVMAQEVAGGGKVILSFSTSTVVQSFALSLEQSQQLRVDARKAEAKSRAQSSQSRN